MLNDEIFYVYVTKYASTLGIFQLPVVYIDACNLDCVSGLADVESPMSEFGVEYKFKLGKNCFRELSEAEDNVENRKKEMIRQLQSDISVAESEIVRIENMKTIRFFSKL